MDEKLTPSFITPATVPSLLAVLSILSAAYLASRTLLPASTPTKLRLIFIWHAFDALIHFILEGSYLYNCFFSYSHVGLLGAVPVTSAYLPPNVYFLGQRDRVYGSAYGGNVFAYLWQEYAKADRRWEGSDLTIISLELLTVFGAGPMAVYVCSLIARKRPEAWFWMTILATGELYGGFMTFAPEWLTGNPNLDASNWMYLWLYLVFFNAGLWVLIPGWILWEAYGKIGEGLKVVQEKEENGGKRKTN